MGNKRTTIGIAEKLSHVCSDAVGAAVEGAAVDASALPIEKTTNIQTATTVTPKTFCKPDFLRMQFCAFSPLSEFLAFLCHFVKWGLVDCEVGLANVRESLKSAVGISENPSRPALLWPVG